MWPLSYLYLALWSRERSNPPCKQKKRTKPVGRIPVFKNSYLCLDHTISAFLPSTAPSPYCGIGAKHQTIVLEHHFVVQYIPESLKNINLVQNIRELFRQDRANGLWPMNSRIFYYLRRSGRATIPVCDEDPNFHLIVLDQVDGGAGEGRFQSIRHIADLYEAVIYNKWENITPSTCLLFPTITVMTLFVLASIT